MALTSAHGHGHGWRKALLLVLAAGLAGWLWLRPTVPAPLTGSVYDLVARLDRAEASPTSPYATQPFGLVSENDPRDALAVLRVPAGTSVSFDGLDTQGAARLEFACGVAWPDALPAPATPSGGHGATEANSAGTADASAEPVRFLVEARSEGGSPGESLPDWTVVFEEVLAPADLPSPLRAVQRTVALPGSGNSRWSLRFSTRRAQPGSGLAPAWPGFIAPQLRCDPRPRSAAELQLATHEVFLDLIGTFPSAEVRQQDAALPVEVAFLDAARGHAAAGGRRSCIRTAAPARVAFRFTPPAGSQLSGAVGMDTTIGWEQPGDGMRFAVEVDGERVWERVLDAHHVEAHRGWQPLELDLSPWAGRSCELQLVTEPLGDPAHDVGGFSHVLVRRPVVQRRRLAGEVPNVVVLLVDTLRADRLGVYGHEGGLTPELDAHARQGLLFRSARSASSWTWPSTASLLTGLPPNVHGVHDGDRSYLVDGHETLAELFARAGYTTAGFSANLLIGRADNFQQGFETFVHTPYARARAMNQRVAAWLEDTDGLARFLYVHTFDPHSPYAAPEGFPPEPPAGTRSVAELGPLLAASTAGGKEPDEALVREYRDLRLAQYEAEVRYVDTAFGELLALLAQHGVLDDAYVVFTSDHGEEFFEHRFESHGGHLYDETIGVPFWITGHGRSRLAPRTVDVPVGNVDLLPTLAALLDLSLPERALSGGSLLEGSPRPVFGQTWHGHEDGIAGFTEKLCVTVGPYKLIQTPAAARTELYDLRADPRELHDHVADDTLQRVQAQLYATLRAWDERTEAEAAGLRIEADEDTLARLQALGYLQRQAPAPPPDTDDSER